ncbi:hypothetical protein KIPB_005961 [Kipferlia bialata]|uniref:Uncharacterized protein n=1 Tax=Kipferlia bialata TaxID=797122 RepID=A0A9K3CWW0_9EUKA|nr:hypothetical protein KIPB_005961 [Kipferlia bialata]|eukprot:g5961.t1
MERALYETQLSEHQHALQAHLAALNTALLAHIMRQGQANHDAMEENNELIKELKALVQAQKAPAAAPTPPSDAELIGQAASRLFDLGMAYINPPANPTPTETAPGNNKSGIFFYNNTSETVAFWVYTGMFNMQRCWDGVRQGSGVCTGHMQASPYLNPAPGTYGVYVYGTPGTNSYNDRKCDDHVDVVYRPDAPSSVCVYHGTHLTLETMQHCIDTYPSFAEGPRVEYMQ